VRAVVAEDDVLLRAGLVRLLTDAGIEVVADVGDADELLVAVDERLPDVVVTDIRMPPSYRDEGTRAALSIRQRHPRIGILVLSQHVEPRYAERLLRDHAQGIGYLLKDRVAAISDFIDAVRRVDDGGSVIDSDVVSVLLSRSAAQSTLAVLSSREREVLGLVAEGRSNVAIADQLVLTARTIETHVANVFTKLGLAEQPSDNRRVLAVLAHLRATGSDAGASRPVRER
jgi:DNA-binding NarL/FixJ family response regulator